MKKILFRVDAYPEVGMGHIIRSSTIAMHLNEIDFYSVSFVGVFDNVSKDILKNKQLNFTLNNSLLKNEETELLKIVKKINVDLLFIDKLYNYSEKFVQELRKITKVVMFHNFCDGAFYAHDFILPSEHTSADILENENWNNEFVNLYYGGDYILINENIRKAKLEIHKKKSSRQICLLTGGSDPKGVSLKLLTWISKSDFPDYTFVFLKGKSYMHERDLAELKEVFSDNILIKDFNYNDILNSEIAIATFGVTTYELMYMEIPTISIAHAHSNAVGSENLAQKKCIIDLGLIDNLTKEKFVWQTKNIISNITLRNEMKQKGRKLIDEYAIKRILNIINNRLKNL